VAPELADPIGAVKGRGGRNVEELGASGRSSILGDRESRLSGRLAQLERIEDVPGRVNSRSFHTARIGRYVQKVMVVIV
jgi:hypothetical protein